MREAVDPPRPRAAASRPEGAARDPRRVPPERPRPGPGNRTPARSDPRSARPANGRGETSGASTRRSPRGAGSGPGPRAAGRTNRRVRVVRRTGHVRAGRRRGNRAPRRRRTPPRVRSAPSAHRGRAPPGVGRASLRQPAPKEEAHASRDLERTGSLLRHRPASAASRTPSVRATASRRMSSRSPRRCQVRHRGLGPAMATQTVPTGFSGVPPPGPATPVIPTPHVAPDTAATPAAISVAVRSETAPCASRVSADTDSRRTFAESVVGDHAAPEAVRRPGHRCEFPAQPAPGAAFGHCERLSGGAQSSEDRAHRAGRFRPGSLLLPSRVCRLHSVLPRRTRLKAMRYTTSDTTVRSSATIRLIVVNQP